MPDSATSPGTTRRDAPLSAFVTLRQLVQSAPVDVPPSASVRETVLKLDAERIDAVVVVDQASRVALGIVTLRDILLRITIEAGDLDAPIASVMTAAPICILADATAHQASVIMVRRGVRYLVLTEADGSYFGIVSQLDLYALPSARANELVAAILAATNIETLVGLAAGIRDLASRMLAERVGADALCQRISALNDLLTLQVIELTACRFELPYVQWCWLVFGSEGRLEQTLSTDQDNGLVFAAGSAAEAVTLRAAFLPFACAVNETLDACGFPLCRGGIMASNPQWCLSLEEWKAAFGSWMASGEPQSLLNSTIFFDLRPLYGQESLACELQEFLLARAPSYSIFLRALVENTINWESPLTWWQGFRYDANKDHPHTIDLKMHGSRPFVDAARIYALAHGVPQTNTAERLRAAAPALGIQPHEIAALLDAFFHIQRLRLENQVAGPADEAPNRVDPDRLHELDRLILKESLKQARNLQQRLARDYSVS